MTCRNDKVYSIVSDVSAADVGQDKAFGMSRTELDSHANMPVVGKKMLTFWRKLEKKLR